MSDSNVFESIKSGVRERFISPLGGFFLLSWLGWNHRFLVILFTGSSVDQKLRVLDNVYPHIGEYFLNWLAYPFISTVIALVLYPMFGYLTSKWIIMWGNKVKIYQMGNSVDLLTQEEVENIKQDVERKIYERDSEIRQMSEKLLQVESERNNIIRDIENLNKELKKERAKNGELDENEKSIILLLGESTQLKVSLEDIMAQVGLSQHQTLLLKKRMSSDLNLIKCENENIVQLTDQGCSTFEHLKRAELKMQK